MLNKIVRNCISCIHSINTRTADGIPLDLSKIISLLFI